jgi:hypothetical protein
MTVDLTPHRAANPVPPYLTVIPNRTSSREKVHASRGQALSAITYQVEGYRTEAYTAAALYAWDGSGWKLLWSCQKGDEITGRPWKAAAVEWEASR